MTEPLLDVLAEAAKNRGLKLVRSRVRTAGKPGYGKVGLTDAAGKPVCGMEDGGPAADPEEVQAYFRKLDARDWGASLDAAVPQRKRVASKKSAANDAVATAPKPKAEKPPKPVVRPAKPGDAPALVELIRLLDHEIDAKTVRTNISVLSKLGEPPLIAVVGNDIVGLCGVHRMVVPHRPAAVGRITILVVAEAAREKQVGRLLVEAAEAWMRDNGCKIAEVTSNDRLTAAHSFYRHLGYERTSVRFKKDL